MAAGIVNVLYSINNVIEIAQSDFFMIRIEKKAMLSGGQQFKKKGK